MPFKPETMKAHRARWFVWAWDGEGHSERLPHTAAMRGLWGWDVECSCGWQTRTGGATRRSVEQDLWGHRWDAEHSQGTVPPPAPLPVPTSDHVEMVKRWHTR